MKPHTHRIVTGLGLAVLSAALSGHAATIWTGPLTNYTQAAPYPGPGDRDQLTPKAALTRAAPGGSGSGTGGIFNAVTETSFTKFVSPADTEWAVGALSNYATLSYSDWTTCGGGNPVLNLPGEQLVAHLISDDIYLSLQFTVLSSAPGFAYTRSTPAPAAVPSVTITNPPDNSVFGNTDSVTIGASVSDTNGSVTNVQFFDGAVLLRSFSAPPYSFSTAPFTFALGLHTLTAVAADTLGATATSAPVRLTVARYTPEVTNGAFSLFLLPVATNMAAPLYGMSPPGDTHRLFVVEQNGLLRIIQDGTLLPGAALDIQSRVQPPLVASNPNDERGLLGLAFHPGFNNPASPGYQTLYTYNSELIPTNSSPTYPVPTTASNLYMNVLNEWKISSTNANVVDPSSRRAIISFGKNAQNHNGGTCTFGPDGYMYLALGDGGNANDVGNSHIVPGGNAQNLITPLGKMLRFDPLNPALNPASPDPISPNGQYRIPTNNPFQGPGQAPEIYAYGLRNPYRFCFDPVTGDLIEADVGQNNIEEINRIIRGGNYGWAVKEGDFLFNMTNGPAGPAGTIGAPPGYFSPGVPAGLIDPISGPMGILEYDHNNGISITGGFVYRGAGMPELYGKYIFGDLALIASPVRENGRLFYADLQLGTINVFTLPQFGSEILPNGQTVHGFGQDADGELYALATSSPPNGTGGVVYKLFSVRLAAQVSGNLLNLSWPVAGGRLQVQTNSPGVGIGTNWVTVSGSAATNQVVFPINPANGSVFYRLVVP
jgi:glucose/arabinose dehydrogenase